MELLAMEEDRDSDFAMLNQPLAAHYEVDGVEGLALRPVPIKPEHKGKVVIGGSYIGIEARGTANAPGKPGG